MNAIDNYSDQEIVQAILHRDTFITKEFLYRKCYPLFKSIFDKYYTDCDNCFEFVNEIYLLIMTPHKDDGRCKLSKFGFRCTLTMWLKIVAENYCHQVYAKKGDNFTESIDDSDRNSLNGHSIEMELRKLDSSDVQKVLLMMPNERYRRIIQLRYIEEKSNEETAQTLSMSMDNYYNKHKLAKEQFRAMLRKEGLL